MSDTPAQDSLARLKLSDGTFVKGLVSGTTETELVVDFASDSHVVIPIGEKIELATVGWGPARMYTCRIIERNDQGETTKYRIRSPDLKTIHHAAQLNRRQAVRVRVDPPGIEVQVCVPGGRQLSVGRMCDISRTGLGMLIDAGEETTLFREWRLEVRFRLTGDPAPFQLVAIVRLRRLDGANVRYGVEFVSPDPDDSQDFESQRERINRYVVRRQVEMLRQARDSRD